MAARPGGRLRTGDLATGLTLLGIAALGLVFSWPLRTGTAASMGPGYLPQFYGFILAGLGSFICLKAVLATREVPTPWPVRAMAAVLASLAVFAVALEPFGLVAAIVGLVVVSSLAQPRWAPVRVGLLAIALASFSAILFVVVLRLPMPLLPVWIRG